MPGYGRCVRSRSEGSSVAMTQVNGVYCRNCTEVAAVKREGPDALRSRADQQRSNAETTAPRLGENRPAPAGSDVGTRLNIRA